jgi:hypothetical protein
MGSFVHLPGKHNTKIQMQLENRSFGRPPKLGFKVDSEKPISTYVLDGNGITAWGNPDGVKIRPYAFGGFTDQTEHEQTVYLPHDGTWYILMVNWGEEETVIWYEVYY